MRRVLLAAGVAATWLLERWNAVKAWFAGFWGWLKAGFAQALEAGRLGCDDGADPAAAVGGARLSLSGARVSAAALARDLGQAQQQLAAVHGGPAPEEEGESS